MFKSCFDAVFSAVIGRQGEMINRLQAESGARIQVAPGEKSFWGEAKVHDDNYKSSCS